MGRHAHTNREDIEVQRDATTLEPPAIVTGLSVSGRGLKAAVWTGTANADGVTLRVDDWNDSTFWLQLRLSVADLERLLQIATNGGAR